MTLNTDDGDLVYVIRASRIDDAAMMAAVRVEQLVDFLLYVKEVHRIVLDGRAARTGRLMGARSESEAFGIIAAIDRREMGLQFVRIMARYRLERAAYVGVTRAELESMRAAARIQGLCRCPRPATTRHMWQGDARRARPSCRRWTCRTL